MMEHITDFNNFSLNEALGVVKSIDFYNKFLTYKIIDELYNFVDSKRPLGKNAVASGSSDIKLNYSQIQSLVPDGSEFDKEYYKFPISEIVITSNFVKCSKEDMTSNDVEYPFMVGGFASSFTTDEADPKSSKFKDPIKRYTEHSITLHLTIEIFYGRLFRKMNKNFLQFDRTKLFKSIESIVSHELTHLYELYNREKNNAKPYEVSLTYASIGSNVYNVPDSVFKIWQGAFTDYIYYSEPHEMNAKVQEVNSFARRMSFSNFKKTRHWSYAKLMRDWDKDEFIESLNKELLSNGLEESVIDNMKSIFIDNYRNEIKSNEENPSLTPDKLSKMTTDKFLSFFGKKIVESGTTLIKNYCRLYSLKLND